MTPGLRIAAAVAIVIGAGAVFSTRSHLRVVASGSDTTEFRARLIEHLSALESTLPMIDALARDAGLGEVTAARTRSLSEQCAIACENLAYEPPADELSQWKAIEEALAVNRDWWAGPSRLREALGHVSSESSEDRSSLADSPHDDCFGGIPAPLLLIVKISGIGASAAADIIPDEIVYLHVIAVISRSILELAYEILSLVDDQRPACVEEKVFDALDELDVMDEKLDGIQSGMDSMERLQIEDDLARSGRGRIGTLELLGRPEGRVIEGKLEKVREIVRETLDEFSKRGQSNRRDQAEENWLRAEYWRQEGLYVEAYSNYRAAYQAGVDQ